jgi:hypothetical protein
MNTAYEGLFERLLGRQAVRLGPRVRPILAGLLVASVALMLPATAARAGNIEATPPQVISGLTPLPREGEPGWCGSPINYQDWEFDDTLAVNPANPDNVAAAWVQDHHDAIVVGSSIDGGATWTKTVISPPCAMPHFVSTDDPSLSFGPALAADAGGILYLAWRLIAASPETRGGRRYAALVSRSLDGGRTWLPAVVVDSADSRVEIDATQVVADPTRFGYAYVLWVEAELPDTGSCLVSVKHYVSHTENGGATWSSPSEVPSGEDSFAVGQLAVLPDGTLLDVAVEVPKASCGRGPTTLVARRSTDFGATWSEPSPIAEEADSVHDRSGQSVAVHDGTIYVSWQTRLPGSGAGPLPFSVMYSKGTVSGDGRMTWQPAAPVGETPLVGPAERVQSGTLARPALAVAADGTVGVAFYDRRNATDAQNLNAVDYWLRHSHDGGRTWQEDHLAGPYDRSLTGDTLVGNNIRGLVGGYQGLAPIPGGFAASFAIGEPLASKNTDIFFSRIHLPKPDLQITGITASKTKSLREGDKVTLTATVENHGDGEAAASSTRFVLDESTLLGTVATDAIPAGGSAKVSVGWDTAGVKGEHVIQAIADSENVVAESNEDNNTGRVTLIVQGNKVSNPRFEQANEQGTGPAAWSATSTGAGSASWSEGSVSLTGNGGSVLLAGSPRWTSDPIPVSAGEALSLRVSVSSAWASSAASAGLVYLDALGQVLGRVAPITAPLDTGGFTTLESAIIVPAGAAQARVELSAFSLLDPSTAGTVTFDDVGLFGG